MRKILLAGVALVALGAGETAMAADLPVKAPIYKAPAFIDEWTGFYFGGNVGYSWGRWDSTSPFTLNFPTGAGVTATTPAGFASAIAADFTNTASPNVKGWVGGGQAGYNWLRGRWLFGLEGDLQASGERASLDGGATLGFTFADGTRVTDTTFMTNRWKLGWFGTLRGRVGMTVADSWLFYATGGLAVGSQEYSHSQTVAVTLVTPNGASTSATTSLAASEATTRAGFAVGAGVEKAIDRNWRLKVEYLYLDFGSHTFLAGIGPGIEVAAGPATFDTNVRLRDNIVRVGVNYRIPPM